MRHLFVLLALASLSLLSMADAQVSAEASCLQKAGTFAQQQACCKANKGICGCRAGKIVCCDKTFADGCSCNREDDPVS